MGQIQGMPLASQQALKEVQTMQILSVADSHHSQHTADTCEQAVKCRKCHDTTNIPHRRRRCVVRFL